MTSPKDRRVQLLQAKELDLLKARLTAFDVGDSVSWEDLPPWVRDELAATRRTDAVPDAALPVSSDEAEVRAWLANFVTESGMDDGFFLLTGIDRYPWLKVEPRDEDWSTNLTEVKGQSPTLLTGDRTTLIVFYEEEYDHQAFRRTHG